MSTLSGPYGRLSGAGHQELQAVLLDILRRRAPQLESELRDGPPFDRQVVIDVKDMLVREFVADGLGDDHEPNRYGLIIEDLIDEFGGGAKGRLSTWQWLALPIDAEP